MKSRIGSSSLAWIMTIFTACASTRVTQQTPPVKEIISQPKQIWVFDFAAMPDITADSSVRNAELAARTDTQAVSDRPLGALIASDLVADIQAMGFSAVQAGPGSTPRVGDSEIRGYLAAANDGGVAQRFIIGFGEGRSEMDTLAEYDLITRQGLRRLGSWSLSSSGSKTPGIWVPVVTAIALGNPLHLIFSGGMKIYGEVSGRSKLEGRAKATADALTTELRIAFQDWGWISPMARN